MRINSDTVKNILVLRNDRFGEFLLNIPAMRALKESFRGAALTAAVDPSVKELAERVSFIDEIIEWGRGSRSIAEKIRLISALRKKKIDIAVMLNPDKDFNIITYLSGIPVRAGYDRKSAFLLTHKIEDRKHLGERHEVEYNLELVSLIGARTEDKGILLTVNEKDSCGLLDAFSLKESDKIVALHPWTSDPVKEWPITSFRELSDRLSGLAGVRLVIVGKREGMDRGSGIFSAAGVNPLDLTGKITLMQLAGVLKGAVYLYRQIAGRCTLPAPWAQRYWRFSGMICRGRTREDGVPGALDIL